MSDAVLIYGATGYTGRLIVEQAVKQGMRPVISGRNAETVQALATEFALEARPAALEDDRALDVAMRGIAVVINCAGPFHRMAQPIFEACVRNHAHYLDITGEIVVFERMAAAHAVAKAAAITVIPGVGFDVVPSDCLAAHLKSRLPSATHLELAFTGGTGLSRGTANTMVEGIAEGGAVRVNGKITRVPNGYRTRDIAFTHRTLHCVTIPWGDVSTAFHSTGIPNICVYTAVSPRAVTMMRLTRPILPLMGTKLVQNYLKKGIAKRMPGPSAERRANAQSHLWGEARDLQGHVVRARLVAPDGYSLTAMTAVAAAQRMLTGSVPTGFLTPSSAFGKDFILGFPRTSREDVD